MSVEKYTNKIWLLESNGERVYDEFAEPPAGGGLNAYAASKARKTLISETTKEGNQMPTDLYPVALVHEHHYEGGHYPKEGLHDIYAVPFFGHELLQQLEGRLLDYVDATYADLEQRKSQKRIMRRILWEFRKAASETNATKFKHAELVEPAAKPQ